VLINSVILVLREVLEAAALVAALMALARTVRLGFSWLLPALVLSLIGVTVLASALGPLTDMLQGTGQEVVFAGLQVGVFLTTLLVINASRAQRGGQGRSLVSGGLMALAVALATTREGAEILLYVDGFAQLAEYRRAVLLGSALGAGIGVSAGILCYAALVALPRRRAYCACLGLLCLLGAGMVLQGAMLLDQAGWLAAGPPLWDSSWLVPEPSIAGQLLYAVLGYEATPGLTHLLLYGASLVLALAVSCRALFTVKRRELTP
jgi:high-affinity iron transporter